MRQDRTPTKPADIDRAREAPDSFQTNVPVAASALVGRETAAQHLRDLASAYRAVTLTGPGGIGKTVLASEVARRLFPTIECDVFFIEMVSLSDPDLVPSAVAGVLGLRMGGEEISPASIARAIGTRKVLLVLDNCEHVIDAAASLVETLLRLCPHATVIATSREVLRIEGEFVYHVAPLEVPSRRQEASGDVLEHSAVQLFIARTRSLRADFLAHDEDLPAIAAICRHLDGIPLAIEFAAARAATLGIQQVAGRLDDRFALLTAGRRTALRRHQTLRATLDWSYELLPDSEQRLLRHLAVFPAGFTLEAAAAVLGERLSGVAAGISNLISKSLATLDGSVSVHRMRLLETIRAYALEKFADSGEREQVARRHAEYYRDLFLRAEAEVLARPTREWLADYAWEIDNLRSALDWAFSPGGGDVSVGIALTAVAVPLWVYLSLIEECRRRVEQALAALSPAAGADAHLEMRLQAALGASLGYIGDAVTQTEAACTKTLDLARSLGNVDYQLRALWGLAVISERETLELAQQFAAIASTPADRLIGDQMIGQAYHFRGNQSGARRHLERVAANRDVAADRVFRFHLDQQPMAVLARVLWLQGLPEKAIAMAKRLVEHAKADDHAHSLCHALVYAACPIAWWVGDLDLAEQYINFLHETSSRLPPSNWHPVGRAYRGVLLIKRGDLQAGLPRLRAAFEECRAIPAGFRIAFIAELAEALCPGQISGGLATMEEVIDRAKHTGDGWIVAELLRVKGEVLRLDGSPGTMDAAEDCFRQALQLARTQDALFWELRAAMSLATLHRTRGRSAEAIACLRPIYDRFTEGFDTAELIAARQILAELSAARRN
jgi:predicted ATPase